jgi:N-acetylmuramoyl-L-alanine amidase
MRRIAALLFLLFGLLALYPAESHAAEPPALYLNGDPIGQGSSPRVVNNFTMVPIRVIAEDIGYSVDWTPGTDKVRISNGVSLIELTFGKDAALVDGVERPLGAPSFVDRGVTYVPLRFVGEQLGLKVYWDPYSKSVFLHQPRPAEPELPAAPEPPGEEEGEAEGDEGIGTEDGEVVQPVEVPRTVPADALGIVKDIRFDGRLSVEVPYEGVLTPNEPFWSGTKLVIDIPHASLSPEMMADLAARKASQGEVIIDIQAFERIRYSYYSNNPSTVRIVFDLKSRLDYSVSLEEGALYVDFASLELPPDARKYKVVIDAGHGGEDPGAPSVTGHWEKTFNLAVARKVYKLLEEDSEITPYMTRSDDAYIGLYERAGIANELGADLFVSIHANRFESWVSGVETYYNRADSLRLAEVLHKHMLKATGLPDRGVRKANFVVIRETTMPAVLLESGYLSNQKDAKLLFTESVQDRIAAEIVAGIKEYLTTYGGK